VASFQLRAVSPSANVAGNSMAFKTPRIVKPPLSQRKGRTETAAVSSKPAPGRKFRGSGQNPFGRMPLTSPPRVPGVWRLTGAVPAWWD